MEKFGLNYEIPSENGKHLMNIIKTECRSHGVMFNQNEIFSYMHEYPKKYEQLSLF